MNTYIALSCLLALATSCHGSALYSGLSHGYGLGYGYALAPAAVSTANVVRAAPIPVIRHAVAPIITTPVIRTVAVAAPVSYGIGLGSWGLGYGGYGLGYGGYGLGHGAGLGYGLGYGLGHGYGLGGWGLGGWGYGRGHH